MLQSEIGLPSVSKGRLCLPVQAAWLSDQCGTLKINAHLLQCNIEHIGGWPYRRWCGEQARNWNSYTEADGLVYSLPATVWRTSEKLDHTVSDSFATEKHWISLKVVFFTKIGPNTKELCPIRILSHVPGYFVCLCKKVT